MDPITLPESFAELREASWRTPVFVPCFVLIAMFRSAHDRVVAGLSMFVHMDLGVVVPIHSSRIECGKRRLLPDAGG